MSATSTTTLNDGGDSRDEKSDLHSSTATAESRAIAHEDEWVRMPRPGCYLLGLGRTYLFQLYRRGKIKTVSLREPGKQRGVRLVFLPSVRSFIEAEAARQNG